ncbi:MAG: hypothetical protein QXQ14_00105 [Candidatus Aenigmatarchaeota archaeon]
MDVNKIIEEYEKSKKLNFYEKFCNFSYNILKFKLSQEELEKFEEVNKFCRLKIYPASNFSASILFFLISFFFLVFLSFFIPFSILFFLFTLFTFISFLIYYYPFLLARIIRSVSSSEIMHAIIYMSISLKQVPNLERAIIFTASNLHGYVGLDFKELASKIVFGQESAKSGLMKIIDKWQKEAKEFGEALKILISYSENPYSDKMLEEAVRIVHEDTFSKLEKYSRSLKLPSTIILGLGIILPLLSLTILPLFSIFFPSILSFNVLIIIFNILIPILLFSFILTITSSRPLTSSYLLIEDPFKIKIGNYNLNLILVLSFISLLLFLPLFLDFLNSSKNYELCAVWFSTKFSELRKPQELNLNREECLEILQNTNFLSSAFPLILLILPFSLLIFKIRKILFIRERTEKIEKEFSSVIFQIGYYLKSGNTLETAIFKGIEKFEKFEIRKFFEKILSNLRVYGNLKEAIFGEKGAIKDYPSTLIKSFFEVIVETYKRGYYFAGEAMLKLSSFLNSLYKLQDKIEELISDVVSNLKFISVFLVPIITGAGISLAIILVSILNSIALKYLEIPISNETTIPISLPFISFSNVVPIYSGSLVFSLGLFVIEIVLISSFLIVSLEKGFEKYYFISSSIKNVLIAIIFYLLTILFSSFLIQPLVSTITQF